MKICAYLMTHDTGLAPNPFHNECTLAVCTPNHQHARIAEGTNYSARIAAGDKPDWIIGLAGKKLKDKQNSKGEWGDASERLVFAMQVTKRLTLNEYYEDKSYKNKIPKLNGPREVMCGDNFYRKVNDDLEHQRCTKEHCGDIEEQDKRGNRVFIADKPSYYYYFGKQAPPLPMMEEWAKELMKRFSGSPRRGIRYLMGGPSGPYWKEKHYKDFLDWLKNKKLCEIPEPCEFNKWQLEADGCGPRQCG